ncbi:MAG TPA: hypothetical protein VIL36_14870 [Acidimicrobiales bacterium]
MALALQDDSTMTRPRPRIPEGVTRSGRSRSRRLGRRGHQALLVAHVLTAVGWFGLAITVAFVGMVGQSRGDVAFYDVIGATVDLSVPLGLAAAATGVALSLTTRWGLARHWWVVAKELGTVAVIATDVLVVAPTMQRAVDDGVTGELPGPVFAHCVVLGLATLLSVVKPKARTPLGVRADARPA